MDEPLGRALLARLAADPDLGVVIAATDALAQRFARAAAAHEAAELSAVLAGEPPPPRTWPDAAAIAVLRAAAARFREVDDLEGLVTLLGAVRATREPTLADLATGLARHSSAGVRAAAAEALESLDLPIPEGPPLPPPNPVPATALLLDAPVRVEVEAESGRFVIELRPDWAPTTVARFLGLVDDGFYDGLTFHRVVPAFVVQGGDPRGDGYGGPGWSQRCEDNRVPYERGTVGMALAGRDTGGSQFFITLAPQPHLDGRYTAFGRVVEGMEVVERVLRGEVMRRVRRQQNHD
jgi:cyclophilin family peptidyl-prolyl cis-trans isomerase